MDSYSDPSGRSALDERERRSGMNYCPACGREVQPTASFCVGCGTRLMDPAPTDSAATTVSGDSAPSADGAENPLAPRPPQTPAPYPPPYAYPSVSPYPPAAQRPVGEFAAAAAQGRLTSWTGQPLSPGFVDKKVVAGILAILLGQLGIHKFILGYTNAGIIMLAVTLVSYVLTFVVIGVLGILAMSVIGIVEGIIYLTKSDDEFVVRYGVNKKSWF
jgi:TM2 domain-containing membrane protein YozV